MIQQNPENILQKFEYINNDTYSYIGFVNEEQQPQGYGIFIDNERCLIFEGVFKNGVKDGIYYQYDINYSLTNIKPDTFKLVRYSNDQYIKQEECFYDEYPLSSEKQCYVGKVNNNGRVEGLCKIIYRNQKMLTGIFKDGKIDGLTVTFTQQDLQFQLDFYQDDQKIYQIAKYNSNWKQYYIQSKYEHNQYVERNWVAAELQFRYIGKVNFLDKANGFGLLQIIDQQNQNNMIIIGEFDKHQMHGYYHVFYNEQKYKIMYIDCDQIENIQQENMKEQEIQTKNMFKNFIIIKQKVEKKEVQLQCTFTDTQILVTSVKDEKLIPQTFQIVIDKINLKQNRLSFYLQQFNNKCEPIVIYKLNPNNVYIYYYDERQEFIQITNDNKLLCRQKRNFVDEKHPKQYIKINKDMSILKYQYDFTW